MRTEDALKSPNYLLVGETVFMPETFYICKDPYSRGGLCSEGSFQIEQPAGFAHYFLDGDVTYMSWEEENQIHSLPVTNPVGENPFHEPKDWEEFQAEVIRCSGELCPGRVSNLTFEKSYMAVSFVDYGGKPGMGWGEGATPNVGADKWKYPYLHNLFEAAREQFQNVDVDSQYDIISP